MFAENCTHILCSDASDILKLELDPPDRFLNVALRANDILIDAIRGISINDLFEYGTGRFALFELGDVETRNRIFPAISEKLIRALTCIRTDLDSFTDREADSLMYYGYRLSRMGMESNHFEMTPSPLPKEGHWRFLDLRKRFFNDDESPYNLLMHLEVGSRQMFKVFLLKKAFPYLIALPVPAFFTLLIVYLTLPLSPIVFGLMILLAAVVLIYTQNQKILKLMDNVAILRRTKHRILKTLVNLRMPEPLSYIMAFLSWVQLNIFDRLFLRYGRIHDSSEKKL